VNRVVYIFWEKVIWDIEKITPTYLNENSVTKLQKADKVVNDILYKNNLIKKLSQVPVILVPLPFRKKWNHSIVLRPFITNDFMTGVPAKIWIHIPQKIVNEMVKEILKIDGISKVIYDLTPKPPGTTEWE
jgi:GMP synthase (glutamine-hydrolysing)